MQLSPGTRVRMVGVPSKVGTVTTTRRPGRGSQPDKLLIDFAGSLEPVSEDQVEPLPDVNESPTDLLSNGKLSPLEAIRNAIVRIHLGGRLADTLYSLETTNTDFYAHQYLPVLKLLDAPTGRLLIADEVGLGKTIEAGLVWTELRARSQHRRLLVVCPAVLKSKWVTELRHRFAVDAETHTAASLADLLENPLKREGGFAAVCSLQALRPSNEHAASGSERPTDRLLRLLAADPEALDLVVVDEAHHMRNAKTKSHRVGEALRDSSKNLLLLSATPVHNGNDDLQSLLRLIDIDTFAFDGTLRRIIEARRPILEARDGLLKQLPPSEIDRRLGEAGERTIYAGAEQVQAVRDELAAADLTLSTAARSNLAARLEAADPLATVVTRTTKREVQNNRVVREAVDERIDRTPAEEAAYEAVSDGVHDYAARGDSSASFLLVNPQAQLASCAAATLARWQERALECAEDDRSEAANPETPGPLTLFLLERAHSFGDPAVLEAEDTKFARLSTKLTELARARPADKVVLFSEYRATLDYLERRLEADGLRTAKMHGGVREDRGDVVERFREDRGIRVLLCSRMGSEGIDLQFSRVLVNYDLPWNPMRIEQRIGRLDRIGQEASKIEIWNMFHAGTIDDRIRIRLQEKLRTCQDAIGGFEDILAERVQRLEKQLLTSRLTPEEQEQQIAQTLQALENRRIQMEELEKNAVSFAAHSERIFKRIRAKREAGPAVSAEGLLSFVKHELQRRYPGTAVDPEPGSVAPSPTDAGVWSIQLTPHAKEDLETWLRSHRLPSDTRLLRPGAARVRFATRVGRVSAARRDGFERIDQSHPVVRFVAEAPETDGCTAALAVCLCCPASALGDLAPPAGIYAVASAFWRFEPDGAGQQIAHAVARVDPWTLLEQPAADRLARCLHEPRSRNWAEAGEQADLGQIATDADQLFEALERRFTAEIGERGPKHRDRIAVQRSNLEAWERSRRERLEEVLAGHQAANRKGLSVMTRKQLDELAEHAERRRIAIDRQPAFNGRSTELSLSVVQLTP